MGPVAFLICISDEVNAPFDGSKIGVEAGLSPMDSIKAATSVSAESLGVDKRTGSIRVGYEADLVAVDRSPLADIRHISDVLLVVNNGKVALNRLDVTPRP